MVNGTDPAFIAVPLVEITKVLMVIPLVEVIKVLIAIHSEIALMKAPKCLIVNVM